MDIHPPHAIHSWKDFGIQLITITAGILIALSLEGVRESIRDRALVREARQNIHREIADNQREVNGEIKMIPERSTKLAAFSHVSESARSSSDPTSRFSTSWLRATASRRSTASSFTSVSPRSSSLMTGEASAFARKAHWICAPTRTSASRRQT